MAKRRRRSMPAMILWDRRQQERFITAVERLVSIANDLEVLLAVKKRRSVAATKANETRRVAKVEAVPAMNGEEGT